MVDITYGSGFVTISEGVSTSGGVSSPTGDRVELYMESYNWDENFKLKPKQTLNGDSFTATKGKVARGIELKNCIILDDDDEATTNTASLNNKLDFLRQFQRIDGKQCYLIIANQIDSVNLKLTEKNKIAQDYMKGYNLRIRGRPVGAAYSIDISFVESTLL